jgi:hypothetical protein
MAEGVVPVVDTVVLRPAQLRRALEGDPHALLVDAGADHLVLIGVVDDHVARAVGPLGQEAGGGGVFLQRGDELDEGAAESQERVLQSEGLDQRVAIGDLDAEDLGESVRVLDRRRGETHLSQSNHGEVLCVRAWS